MVSGQDEYTPSVDEVREAYIVGVDPEVTARYRAEFDRMIERVRREAAAEALEGAAHDFDGIYNVKPYPGDRLRKHAAAIREADTNKEGTK